MLRFEPEGIAAIWPPAGIFLSAILLSRRDLRPWLVGTLFITDCSAEMLAGTPLPVSAIYSLSLTGDAALSAWLLHRFVGEPITFRRVGDVVRWLALSVLLSNAVTSLADAAASKLLPGTHSFWISWQWSAAPEGAGNLLVTPFILTWAAWARTASRAWNRQRAFEGAALFILLALVNFAVFSSLSGHKLFAIFLPYATFPFLLWAALRFGVRGVATAMIILAAIAVTFAVWGRVPSFSFAPGVLNDVIVAELLLAITAVPALLLAAALTEHQQTHNALRESEARFRAIAAHTPDHIVMQDRDLRYQWVVNPQLGLTEADMIGKTEQDFLGKEDAEKLTAIKRKVLERGKPARLEMPLRNSWGETEFFEGSYIPKFDAMGKADGLIGYFRNITERKRAEEALRQSEDRHRTILRTALSGFWRADLQGRLLEVNDAYCQMSGYSERELLAMSTPDLEAVETPAETAAHVRRLLARGKDHFESRHRRKDGSSFDVEVSAQYKPAQGGYVVVFLRDITKRKQAEEALRGLSLRLSNAEDAERRRIARDLHDSTGQKLAALSMSVGLLQDATNAPGGKADNMFADCLALIEQCAQEIRTLSHLLHPPLLDELGLAAAIRNCVEGFSKRSGTQVIFDAPPALERLAGEVEIALFRVVQEGLTNIYRHAGARARASALLAMRSR